MAARSRCVRERHSLQLEPLEMRLPLQLLDAKRVVLNTSPTDAPEIGANAGRCARAFHQVRPAKRGHSSGSSNVQLGALLLVFARRPRSWRGSSRGASAMAEEYAEEDVNSLSFGKGACCHRCAVDTAVPRPATLRRAALRRCVLLPPPAGRLIRMPLPPPLRCASPLRVESNACPSPPLAPDSVCRLRLGRFHLQHGGFRHS